MEASRLYWLFLGGCAFGILRGVVMKNRSTMPLHEAWVIFFFLGVVMLNYPFLHIFNKDVLIFGVPLILVYLMVGWPLSIVVVYFFSIYLRKEPPSLNGASPPAPPPEENQ